MAMTYNEDGSVKKTKGDKKPKNFILDTKTDGSAVQKDRLKKLKI